MKCTIKRIIHALYIIHKLPYTSYQCNVHLCMSVGMRIDLLTHTLPSHHTNPYSVLLGKQIATHTTAYNAPSELVLTTEQNQKPPVTKLRESRKPPLSCEEGPGVESWPGHLPAMWPWAHDWCSQHLGTGGSLLFLPPDLEGATYQAKWWCSKL